jgi:hypothetical protein
MACGRNTQDRVDRLIAEARRMALSKGQRPASKGVPDALGAVWEFGNGCVPE